MVFALIDRVKLCAPLFLSFLTQKKRHLKYIKCPLVLFIFVILIYLETSSFSIILCASSPTSKSMDKRRGRYLDLPCLFILVIILLNSLFDGFCFSKSNIFTKLLQLVEDNFIKAAGQIFCLFPWSCHF